MSPGRWFFGPGHFVIGGFYATNRFDNIYQERLAALGVGTSLQAVGKESGNYGIYALWEQKIYEAVPGSPNGLYVFTRGLVLPKDRNIDTVSAETGAVYKGVFRRQKDLRDSIGIGFAYNSISNNLRRADDVARQEGVLNVPNLRFVIVCDAAVCSGGSSPQDRSAAQLYRRDFESPSYREGVLGNRFWEPATIDPLGRNRLGIP